MSRQQQILEALALLKERDDLTYSELADALEFTRPYISDVMNGKKIPGNKFLKAAARLIDDSLSGPALAGTPPPQTDYNLHDKILTRAKQIMDEEGFTGMDQLVTFLVKEHDLPIPDDDLKKREQEILQREKNLEKREENQNKREQNQNETDNDEERRMRGYVPRNIN